LLLIWRSKPEEEKRPTRLDYRGAVLITGGIGLTVLGLEQSSVWVEQWSRRGVPRSRVALTGVFIAWELRVVDPLLRLVVFRNRRVALDNLALG